MTNVWKKKNIQTWVLIFVVPCILHRFEDLTYQWSSVGDLDAYIAAGSAFAFLTGI